MAIATGHPGLATIGAARADRLIGRGGEMARLLAALHRPPCLILVSGEAGIGKTRLVSAAAERASERVRVLWGVSHPVAEPLPLGVLVSALRSPGPLPDPRRLSPVAGALRSLLPELADLLPPPAAGADEPSGRHHRFRAVRELLEALGPAVLVLEDLQWCDAATAEFLRFLGTEMPPLLAVVLTCRSDASGTDARLAASLALARDPVTAARIDVGPLGADEVRQLAQDELDGAPVSTAMGIALHRRTGGIPFAVEEVVRLVRDRRAASGRSADAAYTRRELEGIGVPWTVRDTVLARVRELPADARRLLEASAVVGAPATPSELAAIAGLQSPQAASALRVALASSLLVEDAEGRCAVRHVLAEEAIHSSIPSSERGALHRRAAAALEGLRPRPSARLARHYREAGAPREWARAAEVAADEAAERLDHTAAVRLVADVAELAHLSVRARARLALKLGGWAQQADGGQPAAMRAVRAVLEVQAMPEATRGELRHLLGDLLSLGGDAAGARTAWLTAADELRGRPDRRAHDLATLALPASPVGDVTEHLRMVDEAMAAAAPGSGAPEDRIPLLAMRAIALASIGDARAESAVDALPWDDTSPPAQLHLLWAAANLIHPHQCRGRDARARELADDAERRAAALGHRGALAVLAHHRLALDWAAGTWCGLADRAQALADTSEVPPEWTARTRGIAGLVALAHGDPDAAERSLRRAAEAACAAAVLPVMASVSGGLACLHLRTGRPDAALQEASATLACVRRKGIWVWAAELVRPLVEALLAGERREEAADLLAEMGSGLRGQDAPLAQAALAWSRGLVLRAHGAIDEGLLQLDRAHARYSALPRPYEAAQIAQAAGECRLSVGNSRGAELLSEALGEFTALEASADVDRVRHALRRHGLRAPRARGGGRVGYGDQLTPRQREVAQLAAAGLTNRQIGERLALSAPTVAYHLGHVMRKTGTRSRVLLARQWSDASDGGGTQTPAPPA